MTPSLSSVEKSAPAAAGSSSRATERLRVVLLDLWCFVPYYAASLTKGLEQAHVEVTLASVSDQRDTRYFAKEGLRNDPGLVDWVAHLRIPQPVMRRALKLLEACANMAALAVRFVFRRPDILHVQYIPLAERGMRLEMWFLTFARRLGIKLVYTVHNVLPHDSGERHREIYRRIYQRMDALICHTEASRNRLAEEFGVAPDRIWVIPHGPLFQQTARPSRAQARAHLGVPEDTCVVLWQGLVKPYKGIEFLLRAWKRLQPERLPAQLVIAGSGEASALEGVRQTVSALGLRDAVRLELRFLEVEELPVYYQAADIVVYPYQAITQSGALLTGLSFGKAIVATALPAFEEVLQNGVTGALVRYGDVEGLAGMLRRLIRDPAGREGLARAASEWSEQRISWPAIAQQTHRCYEAVLGRQDRATQ